MNLQGLNIVVLTGAGISQESGLKTFRDADGLWEGHRVEEVASPEAFLANPKMVHKFYNIRREQLNSVEPNQAHKDLAEFEAKHDGEFLLVTQNVDDLHERAGSKNILHMHGELRKARCLDTGKVYDWTEDLDLQTEHPGGGANGRLRPHICWFGEIPFFMDKIDKALRKADVFIAIGTSGNVYPAAGYVRTVPENCVTVLLNKESAMNSSAFQKELLGPASQVVRGFFLEDTQI